MSEMNKDERVKKKELFLEALRESKGIVATALQTVGVSRQTIRNWKKKDKTFCASCDEVDETQIDNVENELLKKIHSGDTTAIIFYLKTKGKSRGYTERGNNTNIAVASADCVKNRERINALIAEKTDYITRLMSDRPGRDDYAAQIHLAACLLVKLDRLTELTLQEGYNPINSEISREGNVRQSANPLESEWRNTAMLAQSALRALGLNNDAKDHNVADNAANPLNNILDKLRDVQ